MTMQERIIEGRIEPSFSPSAVLPQTGKAQTVLCFAAIVVGVLNSKPRWNCSPFTSSVSPCWTAGPGVVCKAG